MADRTPAQKPAHSLAPMLAEYSIGLSVQQWTSEQTAIVTLSRGPLSATYRMAWLPHATLSELSRLDNSDSTRRLLVASPHISSRTADALRGADIDYIDHAGNAHIAFDTVFIDVRGRRGPVVARDPRPTHANLFSARRMQVLFALLAWPDDLADMPVRRIAEAAGTSVGIAQSTLEIMKESGYLITGSIRRREELLDLWAAAFRNALLPKIRLRSFEGDIGQWSPSSSELVSGESAVDLIRQPQTLTIYTKYFDLRDAVRHGWQQTASPNIEVRQQFWNEPPWATASDAGGAFASSSAPAPLVYADLLAADEPRQLEVAQLLRREQLV
ncbi:type IV toxin-antitoxin system AbiEi family antitoxin [Nocardia sp. NPDC048505]|uniref:type IV toxin-antitoxin system AbiEi family antitoxin n=1 Tax=unclassified Nocardia TaxID=2637762 RepID=UPI0033CB78AC